MKILALDFSSPQRSVAVVDGNGTVSEAMEMGAERTQAFGMIEVALREAKLEREQIECIVVGLGPGSYTGIRAALSIAQGWHLGRGVKLLGISSVEAIAHEAQAQVWSSALGRQADKNPDRLKAELRTQDINVVVDAQRNELYLAGYRVSPDSVQEIVPLRIIARNHVPVGPDEILVGPEVTRWFPSGKIIFPRAATLANLARTRTNFVAGEKLEPIYLRETAFVKAPPSRIIM